MHSERDSARRSRSPFCSTLDETGHINADPSPDADSTQGRVSDYNKYCMTVWRTSGGERFSAGMSWFRCHAGGTLHDDANLVQAVGGQGDGAEQVWLDDLLVYLTRSGWSEPQIN
jgi:hypothetical protein